MIPLFAVIGFRTWGRHNFRLWIPLFLIWLLPLLVFIPLAYSLMPFWTK